MPRLLVKVNCLEYSRCFKVNNIETPENTTLILNFFIVLFILHHVLCLVI